MYNQGRVNYSYVHLPKNASELNEFVCGRYNRIGTLCGKCRDGHYPLAYSFDMNCVECPNRKTNWWKFVLAAFLPLTAFYFFVLFFKINITSSYMQGYVLYSQVVSMPALARRLLMYIANYHLRTAYKIIGSLCGIWNLDVLRFLDLGICQEITSLQTIVLDLAIGVYPILLMVLTYIFINLYDHNTRPLVYFWKPFKAAFGLLDRSFDIRTSLIDAFATFFLLSNVKFLSVSYDLLLPVQVYQINSTGHLTHSWRLYYDATVPYFGETHLPYALLGILVVALLVLLPLLLLILYPFRWFQRILNLLPFRWYILHTFMDAFQGCYKNGTEPGTHDYRWFASVFFILRFLLVLVGFLSSESSYPFFAPCVLVLTTVFLLQFQPFKDNLKSNININITFCIILSLNHVCTLGTCMIGTQIEVFTRTNNLYFFFSIINFVAAFMTIVYITIIILHWIYNRRNFSVELFRRVEARLAGYAEV